MISAFSLNLKKCKRLISVLFLIATSITFTLVIVSYLSTNRLETNYFRPNVASMKSVKHGIDNPDEMQPMRQSVDMFKTYQTEVNTTNTTNRIDSGKPVNVEDQLYTSIQHYHDSLYMKRDYEHCQPRLPSCIILGVMKCGTRELIDFMALHPNIVIKRKPFYELDYFSGIKEPLEWYKRQMPCSYENQITVTKSANYFGDIHAPENLYIYNKTLKMIILVREPIQRVLSALSFHFFHNNPRLTQRELSKMPSVDNQLVDHNTGRVKTKHAQVKLSTYDVAMKHYLQYFCRDQFLIIETEDFKKNPVNVLKKVETFLGLKHLISEDMFVYNQEKKYYCIRNQQEGGMACYGPNRGRTSQKPLQPTTLRILKKYFDQHNEAFFKLINERYDW